MEEKRKSGEFAANAADLGPGSGAKSNEYPWVDSPAGRLSSQFVANSAGNRPPPQPILSRKLSIPGAEKPKQQGRDSGVHTPTVAKLRA